MSATFKAVFSGLAWLSLTTGCGVQAHVGPHKTSTTANAFGDVGTKNETITTKGVKFYDASGMVSALLVDAISPGSDTASHNAAASDEVPMPGLSSSFEYTVGSNDVYDYSHADVRLAFHQWEVGAQQRIGWGVGFFQSKYEFGGISESAWSLPVSLAYTITPIRPLRVTASASLDPLNPTLAAFSDGSYSLAAELGARVAYFPVRWVSVFGGAQFRQTPSNEARLRVRDSYVEFGVTVFYEGS